MAIPPALSAAEPAYPNPLIRQRADPHVTHHTDGYYYFMGTVPEYDRLELRRADSLAGLATAEPKTIWKKHATGIMGAHIWAPELHFIDGKWYIYFAAGEAEKIWNIRIYVLENASANPLEGEWIERGQLKTQWETFALDATTFVHRGQRYLMWAQRDPAKKNNTDLYLAKMDSPLSITGTPVEISTPEFDWEKVRYQVNEGPAVLQRNGRVFVTYSAAGTGAEYCVGLLTATDSADLLDPKSWVKSLAPVFATSEGNRIYGPGHNSFTTAADGSDVMVYHARSYRDIAGDPLKDPNRHTRVQPVVWRADGTPDFKTPMPETQNPAAPAPWVPDLGDGTYKNPVLHADYSDPDAIRVGDDYWLTASSFSHVPGLPILHSKDLVNWELVAHALPRLVPDETFRTPQHGKGVWAPAIRHHDGKFWIYYPDPDFGLYVITAADARGPWSAPVLVKGGKGLIDPCPLWDDDGRLYLIHGWAKSRSGIANVLTLLELSADGTAVIDDFGYVINGNKLPGYGTLEGPKLYKRDGWYYIFAPAGGVSTGWQSVFRSKNIRGPYEDRIVLEQGKTPINGPHQGALVDTPGGENWFLHFQDKEAYGRIVHLQPVLWQDGWPLMGTGVVTGAAKGEPVLTHAKPNVGPAPHDKLGALRPSNGLVAVPPTTDEFSVPTLGLQWQWQANPADGWLSLTANPGHLRLFGQPEPKPSNLYEAPFLLLQKFPALEFTATTKLEFAPQRDGASAGLMVFGFDYAWIGYKQMHGGTKLVVAVRNEALKGEMQREHIAPVAPPPTCYVRVVVCDGGKCTFSYSLEGETFTVLGPEFTATVGRWVGAKVGVFAAGPGHADFDWFRVTAPQR